MKALLLCLQNREKQTNFKSLRKYEWYVTVQGNIEDLIGVNIEREYYRYINQTETYLVKKNNTGPSS